MAKPNVIKKEDLITAAKECLVEKGIEKFTLRAVADVAMVTQGTIYYHFRTKEQLLLEVVKDICDGSWKELSQINEDVISQAIISAKSRCSHDSFFHKLFLTLVVTGFNNDKIREQLGNILMQENEALSKSILKLWTKSPIEGVSIETWGVFLNAIVDGLALQALVSKNCSIENTFEELEQLIIGLDRLTNLGDGK
ncbi:TetR/AcrR family transcriptional regulator [Viridibacillus sp. YIM B01967]|uniref:TetR/AcrR family transcriptional regulator n=1 Tax=Viridibacillus soli TaxID=2798301 RepID=A0ABS1H423_9BACL|nr:TetR/AcrR family transcriptional regulator [Viridibacillus soli]MBK3494147.1 TetR/AcrR family transcriptional regulator [Viridibacillus soli]